MKKPRAHFLSYVAALIIGSTLFATLWKWLFGSASSIIVISGITGVAVAVITFLVWNEFKKSQDDNK